ncbi:hypothetical protein [Rhodoferax sp.]|uniref:hypothetical protein n=1 Tax=Rhodoferax sp. TaxID=50421 RepID=UPI0025D67039|nr:hypothetical protein [Rhodoferax sp.]
MKPGKAPQPVALKAPEWAEEWIPFAAIQQVHGLQVRHRLNEGAIKRYQDQTRAGSLPPPIKIGRTPTGALFLVDGWHRMEAGALQTVDELNGREVLALVADLSEREVRWEAAQANMGHGVQLKPKEYREVFRAFVKAGKCKLPRGRLMSYREIAPLIGKGHTTIRTWMMADFASIAERMGGDEGGNVNAEQPPAELVTLADEQCAEAVQAAKMALLALPGLSPQQRHKVAEHLREVLQEAERLGMEAEVSAF